MLDIIRRENKGSATQVVVDGKVYRVVPWDRHDDHKEIVSRRAVDGTTARLIAVVKLRRYSEKGAVLDEKYGVIDREYSRYEGGRNCDDMIAPLCDEEWATEYAAALDD